MKWTVQQRQAIDVRDKDILVSAAAGSGKTAVMVERVTKMITEDRISLDNMLIVTFTNAAASEMKEKIRRAIRKKLKEAMEEGKKDDAEELRRQLDILPRAQISTFHSFALEIIRRFFYLTDQEPGFRICDEGRSELMQEEALDDVLDSAYEEKRPEFLRFMDEYADVRNDDDVRNIIISIYKKIMALPDPWKSLRESVEKLGEPAEESSSWEYLWKLAEERTDEALDSLRALINVLAESGQKKLEQSYTDLFGQALLLKEQFKDKDIDRTREALSGIISGFPDLRGVKKYGDFTPYKDEAKALKKDAQEKFESLSDSLFGVSLSDWQEQRLKEREAAEELERLLIAFNEIFSQKKKEQNVLDFTDIEHLALEILNHKDHEAKDFYREKFLTVFIDEYQDTNLIQETIIDKIRRPGSLFMVGDVKQSIYKFRLAEPEIFLNKYDSYRKAAEAGDGGVMKIDLNQNFRSRKEILDAVNEIFRPVMKGYDDSQALYPGLSVPPGAEDASVEIRLIDKKEERDDQEEDDALRDMANDEKEARLAAKIIKENCGKKFYDTKTGETRPMRYRDMVILKRSVASSSGIYRDVMKELGIPFYVDDNKGLFDRTEVHVFLNLLRVIDNRYQDVPLISVLRSEIFGFTADELADIRLSHPEGSYARAFFAMCGDEEEQLNSQTVRPGRAVSTADGADNAGPDMSKPDSECGVACRGDTGVPTDVFFALKSKCRTAADKLRRWKHLSMFLPLPDFIWRVLEESRYYLLAGTMPEGAQRQANLRLILSKSEAFSREEQGSLYPFLRYIDNLTGKNAETGQARLLGENDDVVRMMTIHKSKGLEFPLVIVSGAGKRLETGDRTAHKIDFHKDLGLGLNLEYPDEHLSLRSLDLELIRAREREEGLSEEIRIFYVALTRARDRLYITGVTDSEEIFSRRIKSGIRNSNSFLGLLARPLPKVVYEKTEISPDSAGIRFDSGSDEMFTELPSAELKERIYEKLDYEYPYKVASDVRSKYSVTALNRPGLEALEEREGYFPGTGPFETSVRDGERRTVRFDVPAFLQEDKPLTAPEKGIVFHGIMQRIEPDGCASGGRQFVEQTMNRLLSDGIFTEKELKAVNPEDVVRFFRTDIGKRAAEAYRAGKLYREESFDLALTMKGERVFAQGIIDCYFEEDDGLVLIDYKTNRIDFTKPLTEEKERIREMYQVQMSLYAKALSEGTGKKVKEADLYLVSAAAFVPVEI